MDTPLANGAERILPLGVDGRRKEAKRFKELVYQLAEDVANPADLITRTRILVATNLIMTTEQMAHQTAQGIPPSPDDVVRVSHQLDMALKRLAECSRS